MHFNLNSGRYKHGGYKKFIVTDNKRRQISVASVRDRVVHRLLYEYLNKIYDKTFIYDAWSCRKNKGLIAAIERTQKFLRKYKNSFIWRADIRKFFDNADHQILLKILFLRVKDTKAMNIIREIIVSYSAPIRERERVKAPRRGMPIGNLTSQIFANIYLNELDRFVKHIVRPQAYLRYGDDFVIISEKLDLPKQNKNKIIEFIKSELRLEINAQNDIMVKAKQGLKFLGVWIFPKGRKLNKRSWNRARTLLNNKNISSYSGLVKQHCKEKIIKEFNWIILEKLNSEI